MKESQAPSRLSQISTEWTVLREAHADSQQALQAQSALMMRYQRAIRRYLQGCLQDADAAEEVFQDFALRFVRGDFRRVDPQKGRFRDYLRVVLSRMVHQRRKRNSQSEVNVDPSALDLAHPLDASDEAAFNATWRNELLDRAWQRLEEHEQQTGQPFYLTLRYRCEHPDVRSEELAGEVGRQVDPPRSFTAEAIRKVLQRARLAYGTLLLEEVAISIGTNDVAEIEEELADLELLCYCQAALKQWKD